MPVPSGEEQSEIVRCLTAIDERVGAETADMAKLVLLKQGLMQDLLTGRVRVPAVVTEAPSEIRGAGREARRHEAPLAFKRSALAAEIVDQMHALPTFGHVKFMKTLYLVEQLAGVELDGHYHRAAAGPLDNKMIRSVDSQMKRSKWFDRVAREAGPDGKSYGYTYVPMEKAGGHRVWFEKYWGNARAKIQAVIDLLRPLDTRRCEAVATLYEAWRDRTAKGLPVTDEAVVQEVLTNWNESKQAIPRETWKAKGLVSEG